MIDRDRIEAEWAARGYSCDPWVDPPGRCWEDFVHDTDELVLVLDGVMEFEIAGFVQHPAQGEELHIPAHAQHAALGTEFRRGYGAITVWLSSFLTLRVQKETPAASLLRAG